MSTSASWIWNVGIRSASIMMTSGAPVPAAIAVWNLSYSSPPWPTLVQHTWTSSCSSLKLSTTSSMFGYQAHNVTTGTSALGMVFVQLPGSLPPPLLLVSSSSPEEQAASALASTSVAVATNSGLRFMGVFLSGCVGPHRRRVHLRPDHHAPAAPVIGTQC